MDAMEKGKDFGLAAQVSELQWRAEALGRGLRDLARLRVEASDAVVVVEGGALLEQARGAGGSGGYGWRAVPCRWRLMLRG